MQFTARERKMRKGIIRGALGFTALLIAAMVLLASCEGNPKPSSTEPFSVDVIIAEGALAKQAIVGYDGDALLSGTKDITDYSMTVYRHGSDAPYIEETMQEKVVDGAFYEDGAPYHEQTYTIKSIVAGNYDFVVRGYIGDNLVAENRYTEEVTRDKGTVGPFVLETLVDTPVEDITINLSLPADLQASAGSWNASLELKIYQGSTIDSKPVQTVTASLTGADGSYAHVYKLVDGTDGYTALKGGLYTILATLTDTNEGSNTYTSVELMRLFPGLPAEGTISFASITGEAEDIDFSIQDRIGAEISIQIGGTYKVTDSTFQVKLDAVLPADFNVAFYMDGARVAAADEGSVYMSRDDASGSTVYTFHSVPAGNHNWTCILLKQDTILGAGSFSFTTTDDASGAPSIGPKE